MSLLEVLNSFSGTWITHNHDNPKRSFGKTARFLFNTVSVVSLKFDNGLIAEELFNSSPSCSVFLSLPSPSFFFNK